jgi:hypothetical protein
MASRIITCPHSDQPERIDYQIDPLGILIDGCSACPNGLDCPRTCAAELDRQRIIDDTAVEVHACPVTRVVIEARSLLRGSR